MSTFEKKHLVIAKRMAVARKFAEISFGKELSEVCCCTTERVEEQNRGLRFENIWLVDIVPSIPQNVYVLLSYLRTRFGNFKTVPRIFEVNQH